jgi:CRISPR-associated protein (TIGR03986 family)
MDARTARAPYNFVPIPNQIIWRYENAAEVPGHDVLDSQLLTGEIQVTVTAKTPLYIAGRERSGFVKDARGRYVIPGSSLRGLLRQNMQILGLGLIRAGEDFNDYRLVYRDMTSGRGTVNHSLRDRYVGVLGIKTVGERCTVATNVLGGYLHNDGGKYAIVPTASEVIRIKRNDPVVAAWANRYTFEVPVWYRISGSKVAEIRATAAEGYDSGVLLSPGLMRNQNRLYLFPVEAPNAEPYWLTDEEVLAYQEDVKMKCNSLKGTDRAHPMDPAFWDMPKPGRVKAVFYAKDADGFTSFGISQFLRIGYAHSLGYGLPKNHFENHGTGLDYPNSMLGYARETGAYRSRISVGNLTAEGSPREMGKVPVMLGGPKPSFVAGYSKNGMDYNQDFQLNGIKQYWLKQVQASGEIKNEKAASVMYPLPAGTRFTGTIRYRNLHTDELGLLLWCLRLDENCFQNMGMGKPYGFGRVQIQIDELREFDIQNLYRDFTAGAIRCGETAQRVDELIRAYDAYACERLGVKPKKGVTSLRSKGSIQDFLYMKSTVREDATAVSYLSLSEHRNIHAPLPAVSEIRKEATVSKSQTPTADPTDWKAMIAARNAQNAANSAVSKKKKGKW